MVTCLVHWGGRDLEKMTASDITMYTSLIVGITVSIAGSLGGGGESDVSLHVLEYYSRAIIINLKIPERGVWHPLNRIPHKHRLQLLRIDLPYNIDSITMLCVSLHVCSSYQLRFHAYMYLQTVTVSLRTMSVSGSKAGRSGTTTTSLVYPAMMMSSPAVWRSSTPVASAGC